MSDSLHELATKMNRYADAGEPDPTESLVIYDMVPKDIRATARQLMGESLSKKMLERSIACLIYAEQLRARR